MLDKAKKPDPDSPLSTGANRGHQTEGGDARNITRSAPHRSAVHSPRPTAEVAPARGGSRARPAGPRRRLARTCAAAAHVVAASHAMMGHLIRRLSLSRHSCRACRRCAVCSECRAARQNAVARMALGKRGRRSARRALAHGRALDPRWTPAWAYDRGWPVQGHPRGCRTPGGRDGAESAETGSDSLASQGGSNAAKVLTSSTAGHLAQTQKSTRALTMPGRARVPRKELLIGHPTAA